MNESVITIVVTGAVQIVGMIVGFLTLWVKLQFASTKAAEAVVKAELVEDKLDANTATTKAVNSKADTIVQQTNGTADQLRVLVNNIGERVGKLEDYNRESSHRLFDTIHTLGLKVERILAVQDIKGSLPRQELQANGGTK